MWCLIVGAILVLAVLLILSRRTTREGFTTSFQHGWLCHPLVNEDQENILPDHVTFVVEGYNYQDTPIVYRDGKKIVPLQFSWDYTSMAYYIMVAAPGGPDGHQWVLETFDFVQPKVTEGRTLKPVKVSLMRRRYGFNRWLLTP